jgi:hypothetical protein
MEVLPYTNRPKLTEAATDWLREVYLSFRRVQERHTADDVVLTRNNAAAYILGVLDLVVAVDEREKEATALVRHREEDIEKAVREYLEPSAFARAKKSPKKHPAPY